MNKSEVLWTYTLYMCSGYFGHLYLRISQSWSTDSCLYTS